MIFIFSVENFFTSCGSTTNDWRNGNKTNSLWKKAFNIRESGFERQI